MLYTKKNPLALTHTKYRVSDRRRVSDSRVLDYSVLSSPSTIAFYLDFPFVHMGAVAYSCQRLLESLFTTETLVETDWRTCLD